MADLPALTRAPLPAPSRRRYSFTDFQVNNPSAPPPGDRLDGELDQINQALAETVAWASTSLNSDGSLKAPPVPPRDPKADADLAELRSSIAEARSLAASALSSANEADASALAAARQNELARDAAERAAQPRDSADDAASAAESAAEAAASATDAENSANHADLAEALCIDYGVLTQAWAEHMPDTIPPDILATMDVTGDHWSSRWWANRAAQIVEDASIEVICEIEKLWLGSHATPPTLDSCGHPIQAGAMYFNTTLGVTQVYDGFAWHNLVQPVVGIIDKFIYLPTTATSVFSGVDHFGNTLVMSPTSNEVSVYLNGVKLLDGIDFSWDETAVTMLLGSVGPPNVVEIIVVDESIAVAAPPHGVKIDVSIWVFDGIEQTFPLHDLLGNIINPPASVDCLVSLNGVIQEAGADFITSPGFIHFMIAPGADDDKWMIVGLPLGGGVVGIAAEPPAAATQGRVTCEELAPRIDAIEARLAVIEQRLASLEAAS